MVVGWTPSDKSRAFRSLVLGVHDQGELRYAGKVGTGFTMDEILRLMQRMKPLEQEDSTVKAQRAEVRGARWLKPRLVAEIAYTEMTNEGTLRHPSYLGCVKTKSQNPSCWKSRRPSPKLRLLRPARSRSATATG